MNNEIKESLDYINKIDHDGVYSEEIHLKAFDSVQFIKKYMEDETSLEWDTELHYCHLDSSLYRIFLESEKCTIIYCRHGWYGEYDGMETLYMNDPLMAYLEILGMCSEVKYGFL